MRVGIVVPAWNIAPWLGQAISSVRAQTHADWRMVVVDDGSTDGTAALMDAITDSRLTLIRQANAGVSAARNRGFAALDPAAEAVLFLDGDDWLAPDALARLTALLRKRDAVAGVGASAQGAIVRLPPSGDLVERLLWRNRFVNPGQVLIRRSVAQLVGPFDPGLAYGEDWHYLVRLALQGRFDALHGCDPVLHVRLRPGGACVRHATNPAAFRACLDAIYDIPALRARFGPLRLAQLHQRAQAESQWIIGRELIRHGRHKHGRLWLRRSVGTSPWPQRVALFAAAHLLPALPPAWQGPFRAYPPEL